MAHSKVTKPELDQRISMLLGIPLTKVHRVTGLFLDLLTKEIVDGETVQLHRFGTLRMVKRMGRRALIEDHKKNEGKLKVVDTAMYMVSFSKSPTFQQAVYDKYGKIKKEDLLEKYAVDEQVDEKKLEKQANQGCPACGSKVEKHGNVLVCPKHGTEPFESK